MCFNESKQTFSICKKKEIVFFLLFLNKQENCKMPTTEEVNKIIQGSTMELRKLRIEERMLDKLLKEANTQLTQLKVEALEIKNRTRQSQVPQNTEPTQSSNSMQ